MQSATESKTTVCAVSLVTPEDLLFADYFLSFLCKAMQTRLQRMLTFGPLTLANIAVGIQFVIQRNGDGDSDGVPEHGGQHHGSIGGGGRKHDGG
eukprot:SAG31_NODE_22_length_33849_cov_13.713096_25_plen_95_part_00